MKLDEVQHWALVKFGRYSHNYTQVVAVLHPLEEALGGLLRQLARHGETLELDVDAKYTTRLRGNPQERIP